MKRQIANEACSGTLAPSEARARVVVAATPGGPLADALRPLVHEATARLANDIGEAVDAIAADETWVLVSEARLGTASGFDLVRSATSHNPDVTAVIVYDRSSLPDVVRAVRDGTSARFIRSSLEAPDLLSIARGFFEARAATESHRDDRRSYPRVSPPDVAVLDPPHATLVDVTPSGIALRLEDVPKLDGAFQVTLRTSGERRLQLTAEIVRSDNDTFGRCTIAARFRDPTPRAVKALQVVVRRQLLSQGPREMQQRFRNSATSNVVPISAREDVVRLLSRACNDRIQVTIQATSGALGWRAAIRAVDPSSGHFEVDAPRAVAAVAPGQSLDFLLQLEFESYLFEGRLLATAVPRLICEFPTVIYYSEKRSRSRLVLDAEESLRVTIPHPSGGRAHLEFPLLDVSALGASFAANLDRCIIFPGTVLEPLRVHQDGQVVLEERAEVRHVTALADGHLFKIGVHFPPRRDPRLLSAADVSASSATIEVGSADLPPPIAKVVKFSNEDGEEIVGLLHSTARRAGASGPVVVIAPSWGFSKESFSAYALCLVEAFERAGQSAAVLRFDYTHHKGESFIPPQNRMPGREAVDFALSHAVSDVVAAVDFCFANPLFSPTDLVLCGPSFSAPIVLRAARLDPRIKHLVFPMGTPSTQALVKNASGGLDYFGAFTHGVRSGLVDFLGLLLDMDSGVSDAIRHHLAFAADAQQDLAAIDASVAWIAGRHDAWVNPRQVEELLAQGAPGQTSLSLLEVGHLPTHEEGMVVAVEVARLVFRRLGLDEGAIRLSPKEVLDALQALEWARAPKATVSDVGNYWRGYLLGATQESLGFDILGYTREYEALMATQCELLELAGADRLLDAGTGTGQFLHHLLEIWQGPLPKEIEAVDLVDDALLRAQKRFGRTRRRSEVECTFRVVDLATSRLLPIQRFLAGEYHRVACLRGRVAGLTDDLVTGLEHAYSQRTGGLVHSACRGAVVTATDLAFLDVDLRSVALDLGRAARLLKGALTEADLRPEFAAEARTLQSAGRQHRLHAGHLRMDRLDFGKAGRPARLDFADEAFDRILVSLVLPYLMNADETVSELVRALRPGGLLVASTLKPDLDISRLQEDLVRRVEAQDIAPPHGANSAWLLDELRAYTGMAAFLLRLTQERTFRFFDATELSALMAAAGLRELRVRGSFGDPPQAYVVVGRKP